MIRFIVKNRVYIIWIVLVVVAVGVKATLFKDTVWQPGAAPLLAKSNHTLDKNYQLKASDLVKPKKELGLPVQSLDSFLGRHLLRAKKKGDTIRLNEISPLPLVTAAPDSAILLLSLTKEEATLCQWIQKGSLIILCRTDSTEGAKPTDCYGPICVAAAHTNTPQAPGDFLMLQVPLTEVWKVNSCLAASKRSILLLPPKGK